MPDTLMLALVLTNFACIGALPVLFFKRGRLTGAWWITAAPFMATPAFLLAHALGVAGEWPSWAVPGEAERTAAAAVLVLASVALIALTVASHPTSVALWHQRGDAPAAIVTTGTYRRVRHPFYVAFMLAQLAAALTRPHPVTLALLAVSVAVLAITAAREERVLCRSQFGAAYARYMQSTGRFIPRIRARNAA